MKVKKILAILAIVLTAVAATAATSKVWIASSSKQSPPGFLSHSSFIPPSTTYRMLEPKQSLDVTQLICPGAGCEFYIGVADGWPIHYVTYGDSCGGGTCIEDKPVVFPLAALADALFFVVVFGGGVYITKRVIE